MAVKTTLTVQEDFTGEFPAAWAASGLWRFNESEPDSNDRLMDSSGNGRDFNIINWNGTTANLLEGWRGHYFRIKIGRASCRGRGGGAETGGRERDKREHTGRRQITVIAH